MVSKKNKNKPSKFLYWIIGISIFCIICLVILSNLPKDAAAIDYTDQPFLGEDSAAVSIIEFGDYKCPVCKNFNASFFPKIKKDFIDTGKAKFYFMNYPFIHTDSTRSALFAETIYHELGKDAFWKFHELLFEKQPDDVKYESIDLYTETFLKETLNDMASDEEMEKVVQAFEENKYKDSLEKDLSYVDSLSITGTPTIFINGIKFEGNTYEEFKEIVNRAATNK
ncbi:DsbA family protein [Niallia sp. 03190]|uniref:DsbA family protein n=1 Tax=Niallia sp. 03190 TaxID=3458061 RepID=UPI0040442369